MASKFQNRNIYKSLLCFCFFIGIAFLNVGIALARNPLPSNAANARVSNADIVFDPVYSPYYAALNNTEKQIYRELYDAVIQLKHEIKLESYDFSKVSMYHVAFGLRGDQPELFWYEGMKYIETFVDGKLQDITVVFNYNELANNLAENKRKIDAEVNRIVAEAKNFKKVIDKEFFVHDYLIENIKYVAGSEYNQTIYGAFVNHETVCTGFAKSFQVIMRRLGIPTYYIGGHYTRKKEDGNRVYYETEDHAWNVIMIDGKSYHVDLTNDKVLWQPGEEDKKIIIPMYVHFNRTAQDMLDHRYDFNDSDFVDVTDKPLLYPPAIYTDARFENVVDLNYIIKRLSKYVPITSSDIVKNKEEFDKLQLKKIKGPQKDFIILYMLVTNKETFDVVFNYTWDEMDKFFMNEATKGWDYDRKTQQSRATRMSDEIILFRSKYIFIR